MVSTYSSLETNGAIKGWWVTRVCPMPWRYFLLVMAMAGLMIGTGTRSSFAMVMTHISNVNISGSDDNLFPNCTTTGEGSFDLPYDSDIIPYFHTTYFVGSLIAQPPCGIIATRFSPKRVVGYGMLISSVLYFVLPLAVRTSAAAVIILRFLNGVLELGSGSAMLTVVSSWAPASSKTMFMSLIYSGQYISPALAMFTAGATTCYLTWHSILFLSCGFGVIWSIIFLCAFTDNPRDCRFLRQEEKCLYDKEITGVKTSSKYLAESVPWAAISKSMPVYSLICAEFMKVWIFALMGTQIQEYFKDVFRLNTATIGTLSAVPDLFMFLVAAGGGFLFDFLRNRRVFTMTQGRKLFQCTGAGVEAVCIIALYFVGSHQWEVAFTLLCVGVGMSGLGVAGYEANAMDIAPQYTAVISSMTRIGISGGVVNTFLIGIIVGANPTVLGWQTIFLMSGLVSLSGAIFYGVFASGNVQPWAQKAMEYEAIYTGNAKPNYRASSPH